MLKILIRFIVGDYQSSASRMIEARERLKGTAPAGSTPATGCRDAKRSGGQEHTDRRHSAAVAGDEGRGALQEAIDFHKRLVAGHEQSYHNYKGSKVMMRVEEHHANMATVHQGVVDFLKTLRGLPRPKSEGQSVGGCPDCGSPNVTGYNDGWNGCNECRWWWTTPESDGASGPGNDRHLARGAHEMPSNETGSL